MLKLAVVCPTVTGREASYERCLDSYRRTTEGIAEVFWFPPKDEPTWGRGVNVGMAAAQAVGVGFDLIHFTADDIEAHDGWLEVGYETLLAGKYPAPWILNPDGSTFSFGHGEPSMFDTSRDWKPTVTSVVPLLTPAMWQQMAPMIDIHYYTDDYLSHRARLIGIESVARLGYKFTHHTEPARRGAGMDQNERLRHDGAVYNRYLQTGQLP